MRGLNMETWLAPRPWDPGRDSRWFRAFIAVCAGISVLPIVQASLGMKVKDVTYWHHIGRVVLSGGALYPPREGGLDFIYPPFWAVFGLAPLSLLPFPLFTASLCLLNAAAWLAALLLSVRLVTGRWKGQHVLLYIFPAAVAAPYMWDIITLGQVNMLLLLIMLVAFWDLSKGRGYLAGAMVALAAAIKAFPIMAVGYLVWRRQWAALASTAVCLVLFLVVAPAPFRGFHRNLSELGTWAKAMVFDQSGEQLGQRAGRSFAFYNQSLDAQVHRYLRPVEAGRHAWNHRKFTVNVADVQPATAQFVFYGIAGLLCIFYVFVLPTKSGGSRWSEAAAQGMLLILIILFSPLSWSYFYCWLMFPAAAALQFILSNSGNRNRRGKAVRCILASVIALALALSQQIDGFVHALGVTAVGALILFFTLGWMIRVEPARREQHDAPGDRIRDALGPHASGVPAGSDCASGVRL